MWRRGAVIVLCGLSVLSCGEHHDEPAGEGLIVAENISARRAQFVVTALTADVAHLAPGDRVALQHLVAAVAMVEDYGDVHPQMASAIASLTDLPVDVERVYPLQGLQ